MKKKTSRRNPKITGAKLRERAQLNRNKIIEQYLKKMVKALTKYKGSRNQDDYDKFRELRQELYHNNTDFLKLISDRDKRRYKNDAKDTAKEAALFAGFDDDVAEAMAEWNDYENE